MNGQDADTALKEVRARFAALKTLSGLQAQLLAAFQEKNAADGLKFTEICKEHGGGSWGEINRFVYNQAASCSGKTFQTLIAYTGKTELGDEIAACIEQLPGDTWRGLSRFDVETIDHLHLIWEAYARDAEDLRCEDFSRIFPEEMRRAVYGTLIRKREDAGYFANKDAQTSLFAFLASDAYSVALQQCHEELAASRQRRREEWREPISRLEKLYVGRAAQAEALGVSITTLNSLLNGMTVPEMHTGSLQKALALLSNTKHSHARTSEDAPSPLRDEQKRAIALLQEAHERDPAVYSITKMAARMDRPRPWLGRILRGENAVPDTFAEMAKKALPELFGPLVDASTAKPIETLLETLYPEEHEEPVVAEAEAATEQQPTVNEMPIELIETTIGIGLSSIRCGVSGLESWREAMPQGLPFTTKQRNDMARYAARLVRLSGLNPEEVSLAITGEPVSIEDLRGVFGAIAQESRRRS